MNDSARVPDGDVVVETSIGKLSLRRETAEDIEAFDRLRSSLTGAALWRAHLANLGVLHTSGASDAMPLDADATAELGDDDLERTADAYRERVFAADPECAAAIGTNPRANGERSSEYLVRLLIDRRAPEPSIVETTIEKFAPLFMQPGDVRTQLREMQSFLPDAARPSEETKRLVEEATSNDDAVADAQKRVDEISNLLGQREEERNREETGAVLSGQAPAAADDEADPAVNSGAVLAIATEPKPAIAPFHDREREFTALAAAAERNAKAVEQLGGLARSLTEFMVDVDEARRASDRVRKRGFAIGIGVLAVACALSAIGLVQDFLRNRTFDAWRESDQQLQQASQRDLEKEIAQFRDERASLMARLEKLEAERSALAEAAKVAEAARAAEAQKAAEAAKSAKAAKAGKSARAAKAPAGSAVSASRPASEKTR